MESAPQVLYGFKIPVRVTKNKVPPSFGGTLRKAGKKVGHSLFMGVSLW